MLVATHALLAALQGVQLQGIVHDSTVGVPMAGVVVQLLDSAGLARVRGVTNLHGFYRVATGDRVDRVQFLRLGYRPRTLSLSELRDTTLNVALARLPSMLAPVRSVSNRLCPARRDGDLSFALWQQARTGLLESVVAREELAAHMSSATYQRYLARDAEKVLLQKVRLHEGRMAVAFGAAHGARDFLNRGFMDRRGGTSRLYYGPDAETLLHEDFQAGYCMAIADRERGRPNQVGLRFMPARRANERVDIEGTLWIDTTKRAMVDIEWRYVGIEPGATRYRPGGSAKFETLRNGLTLLNRWSIRAVGYREDSTLAYIAGRLGHPAPRLPRIYSVVESGGELTRARFADGSSWRASLGVLRLALRDPRRKPIVGRVVHPDSTDYKAVTDSAGLAVIEDLLPGSYRIDMRDSVLQSLRTSREDTLLFEAQRGVIVDTSMVVDAVDLLVAASCGPTALRDTALHVIITRVEYPDGRPVKHADWRLEDGSNNAPSPDNPLRTEGRADDDGVIAVCTHTPEPETRFWIWEKPGDREKGAFASPQVGAVPWGTGRITVFRFEWRPPDGQRPRSRSH